MESIKPINHSKPITQFSGDYFFLSNFFPVGVEFEERTYKSAEAAYQAAKCRCLDDRDAFTRFTADESKEAGSSVTMREDWVEDKLQVMETVVRNKFVGNPEIAKILVETGDVELVEGNNWNDTFWGMCDNQGENHVGKILMKIRQELRQGIEQ